MLLLLDRAFAANAFLNEIAGTGAMLLARSKSTRNPHILAHLSDGSYPSRLDGLDLRIVEADLTMIGTDGSRVGDSYRLITTLLPGHDLGPALLRALGDRVGLPLPCATPFWTVTSCAHATGPREPGV